jgi:hypothetical protein
MYFQLTNESGKRNRWTVSVAVADLVKACEARMAYHRERLAFWTTANTEAEKELRTDGLTVKKFEVSGGSRIEAQVDPSLAKRVGECQSAKKRHQEAINRFGAFASFCALCGADAKLDLNADDVLYFNLSGADVGGEEDDDEY